MNFLRKIINRVMANEMPKPMGRWNIDYCHNKMNHKIDLSNEDHCGPCGQYTVKKSELKDKNKIKNDLSKDLKL